MNVKAFNLAELYLKAKNKIPSEAVLIQGAKCTFEEAKEITALLMEKNPGRAIGTPERNYPQEPPIVQEVKKVKLEIHEVPIYILKIALAVIAVLAIPRTFEFIRLWLWKFDTSWISILTAGLFVGMLFFFPQVWLAQKKTVQGRLFLAFSIIAIIFSVLTTLDGLYTSRTNSMHAENVQNQELKGASIELPGLQKKEAELLLVYEKAKAETIKKTELRDLEKVYSWQWNNLDWNVKTLKKDEKIAFDSWILAQKELHEAQKGAGKLDFKRADFMSTSWIEWIMLVCFSLIIDLVGPMALAVSLFLRKEGGNAPKQ